MVKYSSLVRWVAHRMISLDRSANLIDAISNRHPSASFHHTVILPFVAPIFHNVTCFECHVNPSLITCLISKSLCSFSL
jgi:hypothetical protein